MIHLLPQRGKEVQNLKKLLIGQRSPYPCCFHSGWPTLHRGQQP